MEGENNLEIFSKHFIEICWNRLQRELLYLKMWLVSVGRSSDMTLYANVPLYLVNMYAMEDFCQLMQITYENLCGDVSSLVFDWYKDNFRCLK